MQLKVVTWNIFAGQKLDEVIALLKTIDADVIALQEVFEEVDGTENQAQKIAEALGMHFAYAPAHTLMPGDSYVLDYFHITRPMAWGNAVLTKEPISASKVHMLSEDLGRVAVEVTVNDSVGELHFFSTHLVSGPAERAQKVRLEQVKNLISFVPKVRTIVMGDFNAPPDDEVISIMNAVLTSTEADPTRVPTEGGRQIDYLFTTSDFERISGSMPHSEASDHFPLVATLRY